MNDSYEIEHQEAANWCWAAVGVSISHYLSPESTLSQCQLARRMLGNSRTCETPLPESLDRPQALQDVLTNLDALLEVRPGVALSFREIFSQIDMGLPVCARIGWVGDNRGHFVVIVGCPVSPSGEQWVDIADPFFPQSTIPYDEFVSSYHGSGRWTDTFLIKRS